MENEQKRRQPSESEKSIHLPKVKCEVTPPIYKKVDEGGFIIDVEESEVNKGYIGVNDFGMIEPIG